MSRAKIDLKIFPLKEGLMQQFIEIGLRLQHIIKKISIQTESSIGENTRMCVFFQISGVFGLKFAPKFMK